MHCTLSTRSLALSAPLTTAVGVMRTRTVWVLTIGGAGGLVGLGEAAPLPGFGGEAPTRCAEALLMAVNALSPEFIAGWLNRGRADAPLGALEKELADAPCARSAVEGALLDLLARMQKVPVAEMLDDDYSPWLPVNALLGFGDDIAAQALALRGVGFSTFKVKLASAPAAEAARLRALRKALGSEVRLRADANGSWTLDQALVFAEDTADLGLEYCEQPLPADDLEGLATLRRRSGMKVAADESIRTAVDVGRVASAQAADVVVLKPMFMGGWRPTRQAVQLAKSCGMDVVITTALDGSIGRAHATHIASALGLDQRAHGLATGDLLANDLTSEPLKVSTGEVTIHARPGLGIGDLKV